MILGQRPATGLVIGAPTQATAPTVMTPAATLIQPLTVEPQRPAQGVEALASAITQPTTEEELFPDHEDGHGLDGAAILSYHEHLSPLSAKFCPVKAREAGLYFGYPRCCVDSFLNAVETGQHLQRQGASGFIPCAKCLATLEKTGKGVESLITNRVCARPFPNSVAAEDINVLVKGRPTATMLRILRVHMRIDSSGECHPETVLAEEDKISRMPRRAQEVARDYLAELKG